MDSNSSQQTRLIYILYIIGAFIWLVMLVGVILAYIEKGKATDAAVLSHLRKQIRLFWLYLLFAVAGIFIFFIVLMVVMFGAVGASLATGAEPSSAVVATSFFIPFLIGFVMSVALIAYVIVTCVKGLKRLDEGQAMG